jgi:hypothetical protein
MPLPQRSRTLLLKLIIFATTAMTMLSSHAQSTQSPACRGKSSEVRWDYCTGTMTLPDGSKYVGEFLWGKFHGDGTITFKNGYKYVGEFSQGFIQGRGTTYKPDGTIERTGLWHQNKYVGEDVFAKQTSEFGAIKSTYISRKKSLLEQVFNYSSTGLEEGSDELFWIQGKGKDRCVLSPVSKPIDGFPELFRGKSVDVEKINQTGFRISVEGSNRLFGDEQFSFLGPSKTVIERLQKAWGLAFKECPSQARRAF